MLKFTCDPSVAAGGRSKGCCTPSQMRLLVKGVSFEKMAQIQRKTQAATTKGQNRLPALFSQFLALFHNFSHFFRVFPPGLFLRSKGFYYCFT